MRLYIILFLAFKSFAQLKDCSTCSSQLLEKNQLEGKSIEELMLLRNEIYARKGYVFQETKFSNYFEKQVWYKPLNSNEEIKLLPIEIKNIQLLKDAEIIKKAELSKALDDLRNLKNAFIVNDSSLIKLYTGNLQLRSGYSEFIPVLKEILLKVDLDEIHWNKTKGLYKLAIDNGYRIVVFELIVEGNQIYLRKSHQSNSEIFGDFDDGYSDYQSESEYMMFWLFEFGEKGIVAKLFDGAGG